MNQTDPEADAGNVDHTFQPLTQYSAELGESPSWSAVDQAIWWVDIVGNKLVKTKINGATQIWETPEIPGFVQYVGNQIYVGMQTGIFRFAETSARFEKVVAITAKHQRFNDACTDSEGRIWAGTMDVNNQNDDGVLYLFDTATETLTEMMSGFRTINGLAVDVSRNRLFLSDSHPFVQTVWTSRIKADGTLADREVFARFNGLEGRPDGAWLDPQGEYWIAAVGGGAIFRFSPEGEKIGWYPVPVKAPTKLCYVDSLTPALILTSFKDETLGGRLLLWQKPPFGPQQEYM